MADAKANIMITVASIVFSVTIANLSNEVMKYPLLAFAGGCFFSLLFAIFAIIPKTGYPKIKGSDEIDRESPYFNPLFFGHFAHIPIEEYKEDYAKILMTDDLVYDALTSDIYGQGKVLALSKYKFLRWSYSSFLYGMVAAISVFLLHDVRLVPKLCRSQRNSPRTITRPTTCSAKVEKRPQYEGPKSGCNPRSCS